MDKILKKNFRRLKLIFANVNVFLSDQQCSVKADICFLIDSSGSIRDDGAENWDIILDFASQVSYLPSPYHSDN